MNQYMLQAFQDELAKIAGAMEDAAAEERRMLQAHASNPAFVSKLQPGEQMRARMSQMKAPAPAAHNATVAADAAEKTRAMVTKARGLARPTMQADTSLAAMAARHMNRPGMNMVRKGVAGVARHAV